MSKRPHHKEVVATATRQLRRQGRERLALELFDDDGHVPTATMIAAHLESVAGSGITSNERRNEALRGAAELLDELATLLRQSACVNG